MLDKATSIQGINQEEIKENDNKWFVFYGVVTILFASFLELMSLILREPIVEDLDASKHVYLVKTYPLLMQTVVFVFASFFLANLSKMKDCMYSVVAICLFFVVQSINLLFLIFSYGAELYDAILYPLLIVATLIIGGLKFILKK